MKLVLIEWVDSHSSREWKNLDDHLCCAEVLHCRSVGWLISDTKKGKMIVSSLAGEKDNVIVQGCNSMFIPARAITKVTVLRG